MSASRDIAARHLVAAHAAVLAAYALLLYVGHPYGFMGPDNWSYIELARSLEGEPYRFLTLRSYLSLDYSAAFPVGYPAILHALHLVVGPSPYAGTALNVLVAMLVPAAVAQLAVAAGARAAAGWIAGLALLCFRPFIVEVLGGGTIPLATLATIAALLIALRASGARDLFVAGLAMGLACLLRFDRVPLLALMLPAVALHRRQWLAPLPLLAGALLAMSPWILLGWLHFGQWWVSDNNWVALAAHDANVTDYPAAARETLWTDPAAYLAKCLSNLGKVVEAMFNASGWMLLLPLSALAWWRAPRGDGDRHPVLAALALMSMVALAPLVMTAYASQRYFSLFFLLLLLFLLARLRALEGRWMMVGIAATMVSLSVFALQFATEEDHREAGRVQTAMLSALRDCQDAELGVRYVFPRGAGTESARFGAEFGGRSAFMPRNLARGGDRTAFERAVGPLRYVRHPLGQLPATCGDMLSPIFPPPGG